MKTFVLDTNVVLHDPFATTAFDEHRVMLPMTVLEELDSIKGRGQDISRDARIAIRHIESIIGDAPHEDILNGVGIAEVVKGHHEDGKLAILPDINLEGEPYLDQDVNDNKIINAALYLQSEAKEGEKVVLVTNDINMRLKAKGAGVDYVEAYSSENTVADVDLLHRGYQEITEDLFDFVDDYVLQTPRGVEYRVKEDLFEEEGKILLVNDYIIDVNEQYARVARKEDGYIYFLWIDKEKANKRKAWGITPKDTQQALAMNALLDPEIDLTVLLGPAGTGKTLITMATALEQAVERGNYSKIIFSRSLQSQFEDIGFLPGNEHEKVSPWAGGAFDALEYMHKDDVNPQESVKHLVEDKQIIQFKALNFIRGRSFQDTILVIDEAQNLTATQMKTIISRCGENTKIILMGNLAQIDNDYVSPISSGLTYVTEKFKDWEGAVVLQLEGVVRSRLAKFAEDNL